jgi:hypothetical protein
MKGLLWGNPKNRFTIEKAIAWVKLIITFKKEDPFIKNKDPISLVNEMKSKSSPKSIEEAQLTMWFNELNKPSIPVKPSRFTVIKTTHPY